MPGPLTNEQVTIIRAQMDASSYTAGADQVAAANEKIAGSGEPVAASQEKLTRKLLDSGGAFNRIARSVDPAIDALQKYETALLAKNRAVEAGRVTEVEGMRIIDLYAHKIGHLDEQQRSYINTQKEVADAIRRTTAAQAAAAAQDDQRAAHNPEYASQRKRDSRVREAYDLASAGSMSYEDAAVSKKIAYDEHDARMDKLNGVSEAAARAAAAEKALAAEEEKQAAAGRASIAALEKLEATHNRLAEAERRRDATIQEANALQGNGVSYEAAAESRRRAIETFEAERDKINGVAEAASRLAAAEKQVEVATKAAAAAAAQQAADTRAAFEALEAFERSHEQPLAKLARQRDQRLTEADALESSGGSVDDAAASRARANAEYQAGADKINGVAQAAAKAAADERDLALATKAAADEVARLAKAKEDEARADDNARARVDPLYAINRERDAKISSIDDLASRDKISPEVAEAARARAISDAEKLAAKYGVLSEEAKKAAAAEELLARSSSTKKQADDIESLTAKYDPLLRATRNYKKALEDIDKLEEGGHFTGPQAKQAREDQEKSFARNKEDIERARKAGVDLSFINAGVAREGVVLVHELLQGNFNRLLGSLLVMTERVGGLGSLVSALWKGFTSPIGLVVTGVTLASAALLSMGIYAEVVERQLGRLSSRLRAVRDDSREAAVALTEAAKYFAENTIGLSRADAIKGAGEIGLSPQFQGNFEQTQALFKTINEGAKVTGETFEVAAKQMALAFRDPNAAAEAMSKTMTRFTVSVRENIKDLQDSGQTAAATAKYLEVYNATVKGSEDDTTALAKALHELYTEIFGAAEKAADSKGFGGFINDYLVYQVHRMTDDLQSVKWFFDAITHGFTVPANPFGTARPAGDGSTATTPTVGQLRPFEEHKLQATANRLSDTLPISGRVYETAQTVARIENDGGGQFDARGNIATSSAGALGEFQIKPETADQFNKKFGTHLDIKIEEQNRELGIRMLEYYDRVFDGNRVEILSAFHGGEGSVGKQVGKEGAGYLAKAGYQQADLPDWAKAANSPIGERPEDVRNPAGTQSENVWQRNAEKLRIQIELQEKAIELAKAERDEYGLKGNTAGVAQDDKDIARYQQRIYDLGEQLRDATSKADSYLRKQRDALLLNQGSDPGGQRELAKVAAQFDQKRLPDGTPVGEPTNVGAQTEAVRLKQDEMDQSVRDTLFQLNLTSEGLARLSGASKDGALNLKLAADAERARVDALKSSADKSPAYDQIFENLKRAYQGETLQTAANDNTKRVSEDERRAGQQQREDLAIPQGGAAVEYARNRTKAENDYFNTTTSADRGGLVKAEQGRLDAASTTKFAGQQQSEVDKIARETAALEAQAAVVVKGGIAAEFAGNAAKAADEVRARALPNTLTSIQFEVQLTAEMNRRSIAQRDERESANLGQLREESALISAETALIGKSVMERTREVAILRERAALGLEPGAAPRNDLEKSLIDGKAAVAGQKVLQDQAQQNYNEMAASFTRSFDSIGDGLANALLKGKGAAVDFQNVTKQVVEQIIQEMLKLAVINPILNAIFPSADRPEIGGVADAAEKAGSGIGSGGGLLGSLFGSANAPAGAAAGADAADAAPAAAGGIFGSIGSGAASARSYLASLFHEGGVAGYPSNMRMVDSRIFDNAPRFHAGLADDEFAAVLQRGERVMTANQNSRNMATMDGLTRQASGNSATNVTFNVTSPNADSFKASQGQLYAKANSALWRSNKRAS